LGGGSGGWINLSTGGRKATPILQIPRWIELLPLDEPRRSRQPVFRVRCGIFGMGK